MDILLYASYKNSTTTLGETGLTPTCTIWSVLKVSPYTETEVISAQAMTEVGRGLYLYPLASVTLSTHDYVGVALTSSADVIDKEVHMLRWDGAESHDTELSRLDIVLSTVPALVWAVGTRTLTSFGTLVADIWAYVRRTLTMTTEQILSVQAGADIAVLRGDTLSIPISDLGSLADNAKIHFTVRKIKSLGDSVSEIQVEKTDNLLYIAGAAPVLPVVASDGTLTVADETDGDIVVLLKPAASALLTAGDEYSYDVQLTKIDESVTTLREGIFTISQDVTRYTP